MAGVMKRRLASLYELSKEQLVKRLLKYEPEVLNGDSACAAAKRTRSMDMSAYLERHVALKVVYFGKRYHGFASQTGLNNMAAGVERTSAADTVEDYLFRALLRTRLLLNSENCGYSRCGRTDAGVSSTGQVVALRLRASNRKIQDGNASDPDTPDYVNILNKQLPDDIRVIDWTFVPDSFSARFSCTGRLYHYYFPVMHYDSMSRSTGRLDIESMRLAAEAFVGVHNFCNFCRRDPSKPNQSLVREVYLAAIEPVPDIEGFYCFTVKGSAFLYHQVRCMMAVLFMVGHGLESPSIIETLLAKVESTTVNCLPGPLVHYEIAPETPLVLSQCFFNNTDMKWQYFSGLKGSLNSHLALLWQHHAAESLIIKELLSTNTASKETSVVKDKLLNSLLKVSK